MNHLECCGNCKFFHKNDIASIYECRRYPPIFSPSYATYNCINTNNQYLLFHFPIVDQDLHWCGEYKEK